MWNYQDLAENPVNGINAAPLERDVFEWHGNLYFDELHDYYPGLVVHFYVRFPCDFPNSAPSVFLHGDIVHSHVFDGSICFSLVSDFAWYFQNSLGTTPQCAFWHPGRTVRTFLEALYLFITVDEDNHRRITKRHVTQARQSAAKCVCNKCGHSATRPWPAEEAWLERRVPDSNLRTAARALAYYQSIVPDRSNESAQALSKLALPVPHKPQSIAAAFSEVGFRVVRVECSARPAKRATRIDRLKIEKLLEESEVQCAALTPTFSSATMEDLRCAITQVAFDQSPDIVLGFGVKLTKITYGPKKGMIDSITTDLEPISYVAFTEGDVRRTSTGATFTYFLPFAINAAHWKRAKAIFGASVQEILRDTVERTRRAIDDALLVLGELWKSNAVLLMNGNEHVSEKVLKGFCAIHHLMLALCEEGESDGSSSSSRTGKTCGPEAISRRPTGANRFQELADGWMDCGASDKENRWEVLPQAQEPQRNRAVDLELQEPDAGFEMVAPRRSVPRSPRASPFLKHARRLVSRFVFSPHGRHKSACPNLGRFMPLLLLADQTWNKAGPAFVSELLARNALWVVKANPGLATVSAAELSGAGRPATQRLKASWAASATGLKLMAFQLRFFLRTSDWVREFSPQTWSLSGDAPGSVRRMTLRMYESFGGRPSQAMIESFQREVKAIENLDNYMSFFEVVGMPQSGMSEAALLLCDAMKQSERCKYHRNPCARRPAKCK